MTFCHGVFFQCCGSGSGIRDPVPFWPLDPDPDPNPYFWEVSDKSLGKKFYNSLKTGQIFLFSISKIKIIFNFVKFVATKKDMTTNFFLHPSLLLLFLDPRCGIRDPWSWIRDLGSGIRDPGSEIRDPGWVKIRIRDPEKTSRIRNTAF